MHRVFKTRDFNGRAAKSGISDAQLCRALQEVRKGQADDLGGGVWKKRLNENRHRSIILAKGSHYWVYQFLFAKQNQDNITQKELVAFRKLAKIYEGLNPEQVQRLVDGREFMEICHE